MQISPTQGEPFGPPPAPAERNQPVKLHPGGTKCGAERSVRADANAAAGALNYFTAAQPESHRAENNP